MMRLKGSVKLAILKIINLLAMLMVVQTANTACIWVVYQPEFPDEASIRRAVLEDEFAQEQEQHPHRKKEEGRISG